MTTATSRPTTITMMVLENWEDLSEKERKGKGP
jgi:hypothetical protein